MPKSMAWKVIGPNGEPTIVLLNGHVVKLPHKYLCLYPLINVLFSNLSGEALFCGGP